MNTSAFYYLLLIYIFLNKIFGNLKKYRFQVSIFYFHPSKALKKFFCFTLDKAFGILK